MGKEIEMKTNQLFSQSLTVSLHVFSLDRCAVIDLSASIVSSLAFCLRCLLVENWRQILLKSKYGCCVWVASLCVHACVASIGGLHVRLYYICNFKEEKVRLEAEAYCSLV